MYRILGKKPEKSELNLEKTSNFNIESSPFSENVLDYSKKQILYLDKSFDFDDFLDGAKNAFSLIVTSFNNGNLKKVKPYLSSDVYKAFEKVAPNDKQKDLLNITSLKASITEIEVIKKLAKIKVEFISIQEKESKKKNDEVTDIWTFEKEVTNSDPIWILSEVHST